MAKRNNPPKEMEMKQVDVKSSDIFADAPQQEPQQPSKKLPEARNNDSQSQSEEDFDIKFKKKGKQGEQKPLLKKKTEQKDLESSPRPVNPKLSQREPENPYAKKNQQTPQYTPEGGDGADDDDLYDDEIYANYMQSNTKFWQLAHYKNFFDVSTMDVLHRLRKSIWPFCSKAQLFEDDDRVDLFGPFWIMMTLIVEIAIIGFINNQIQIATLALEIKNGKFITQFLSYNLLKVARSAFVMIGYFIINPLMCLLLIKYVLWVPDMRYLWLFAIYGYSFTVFIITTVLNVIPIEWLRWVFLSVSGVVSLFFIFSEMYALIKNKLDQGICKFLFVCLYLTASHLVFIFALKEYFLETDISLN